MTKDPDFAASGLPTAVGTARELLRAAHGTKIEAEYRLELAGDAARRAREFVAGATERRDKFREIDRSIAVDRSAEVKAALLAGRAPTFVDAPGLSRNAAALLEAQGRVDAAEIACAEIEAEASEAQTSLNAAKGEVRAAADALLIALADAVAQEVEALEAHAVELRTRLGGGSLAPTATSLRGAALTPALTRVLVGTDRMEFQHNSVEDLAMRSAARGWLRLIGELVELPDAELRLDDEPQPQAIAAE